jgi:hypothetical protein
MEQSYRRNVSTQYSHSTRHIIRNIKVEYEGISVSIHVLVGEKIHTKKPLYATLNRLYSLNNDQTFRPQKSGLWEDISSIYLKTSNQMMYIIIMMHMPLWV